MLNLRAVSQFKKDLKKYHHKKSVLDELEAIVLSSEKPLPIKHRDHSLSGNYSGMRECHVRPDVLLVYWINESEKVLYLERIGTHSDLF